MEVQAAPSIAIPAIAAPRRTGRNWLRRLFAVRLALPAAIVLLVMTCCALFSPVLAPYDPLYQDYDSVLSPPSSTHLMGTDDIGRDVLSRIIYSARVSMSVGMVAVGIALVIGVPIGLVAAYRGGWMDDTLMRVMDAISSFPALLLALGITVALKPGLLTVMVAIGVVYLPGFARLARGEALSTREREFVTAARVLGARPSRVIARHLWPNVTAPLIVLASLRVAAAIVTEASLSFLGAGVPPPTPSWGLMLKASYQYTETSPWLALFPGLAIFITVLATNIFGDALRSALDPRLQLHGGRAAA